MVTEGLSLNPSKTRITSTIEIQASSRQRLEDVFSNAEFREIKKLIGDIYSDDDDDDEGDPGVVNPFITGDNLLDRLDDLKSKSTDLNSRKAVLKVLRRVSMGFNVDRLLEDHSELAYYLPRDFCRAVAAACQLPGRNLEGLAEQAYSLLRSAPISELPVAKAWILNLYASGSLPSDPRIIVNYPASRTVLEERQLIYIRARIHDRPYFREHRGRLGQVGDHLKPALLMGGKCLPEDEYRHWIAGAVEQWSDPLSSEFCDWLRDADSLEYLLAG